MTVRAYHCSEQKIICFDVTPLKLSILYTYYIFRFHNYNSVTKKCDFNEKKNLKVHVVFTRKIEIYL